MAAARKFNLETSKGKSTFARRVTRGRTRNYLRSILMKPSGLRGGKPCVAVKFRARRRSNIPMERKALGLLAGGQVQRQECLLVGFLLASSLLLLLFSLLPTGIGVVFLHGFGENIGLLAEVLLIHHSIFSNDEGHHSGRPVFRRIGHESETPGHFAVYHVTFRAARAIFSLTRQDVVVVTAVRSRSAIAAFGIALCNGRRHQ